MSNYCNHCGTVISDETDFCPSCGMRLKPEETPAFSFATPEASVAKAHTDAETPPPEVNPGKKPLKSRIIFLGGVLVGIALGVLAMFLIFGHAGKLNNTPEPPFGQQVMDYWEAVLNGDADKVEFVVPLEYWTQRGDTSNLKQNEFLAAWRDSYAGKYEKNLEDWTQRYGDDPTISIKVLDSEAVDGQLHNSIVESMEQRYGIDPDRVKEIRWVIQKKTYSGTTKTHVEPYQYIVVQIDSQFYAIEYYSSNGVFSVNFLLPR